MAPKTPSKKDPPRTTKKNRKPGHSTMNSNKPTGAVANATTNDLAAHGTLDYHQVQADEIEALQAIFMEDYKEIETKSAWNTSAERAFRLNLHPLGERTPNLVLSVRFTATYPKSAPLLELDGLNTIRSTSRDEILNIVKNRPKELLGDSMIHHIAADIQEVLEETLIHREPGLSLEDERRMQETAAEKHAKEVEAKEVKLREAAKADADRLQKEQIQKHVDKYEKQRSTTQRGSGVQSPTNEKVTNDDELHFDQMISLDPQTDLADFSTVTLVSTITTKGTMHLFTAKAKPPNISHTNADLLAVRQVRLTLPSGDNASWESLLVLEDELSKLKAIRHPNIINVHAFKIERTEDQGETASQDRVVSILTDLANRGSLAEMLEDGQVLPPQRARQWSLDLLDALEHYHAHGIVHRRIQASNVLIARSSSGVMMPKLSDADYEDRLLRLQNRPSTTEKGKKLAAWYAPEISLDSTIRTRKSDIWDFGVVLVQMLFGIPITRRHSTPHTLIESLDISEPLENILNKVFSKEGKDRPSAFELKPSEFFRRSDAPIMAGEHSTSSRRRRPSSSYGLSGPKSPMVRRSRQNSHSTSDAPAVQTSSRYVNEFVEQGRLGKGGFGEVVKARNKTDNSFYAIKKVKQESADQLQQVLSEVMLLSRLNNPFVVRYHAAWVEDDFSDAIDPGEDSMSESFTSSAGQEIEFGLSSRGLDFASSQGYDNIVFGDDSSTDDDELDEAASGTETGGHYTEDLDSHNDSEQAMEDSLEPDSQASGSAPLQRTRSGGRRIARSILYIQMEYCEKHTLRDLIRRGMYDKPQDAWLMLRHILEGLAHIHRSGIIHRDLKPENIFIDKMDNPRIGDFGLATTSRVLAADKLTAGTNVVDDMTTSIGTTLYVAPEVRSGTGNYNDKVDMYSLGIMFFEMCYPLKTAMERHQVITGIRERSHVLPPAFQQPDKLLQSDVILSLIKHAPGERPSSSDLLRSGKLPLHMKDETLRQTLQSMMDSNSEGYSKMMAALFAQTPEQHIRGLAWGSRMKEPLPSSEELRLRDITREVLYPIFRSHGAEETHRHVLSDRSNFYTATNVVQLIDQSGNLLQLPYDLTLPHAKQLAMRVPEQPVEKTFVFGHVYREAPTGGPPLGIGLVDFNIVAQQPRDHRLHEAECMKVVEEVIDAIPTLASTPVCFYIAHSELLELILDYCRIDKAQRLLVKESLSKLNIRQFDWQKVKAELRSPLLGIHTTSLDELAQFNFRETPEKIYDRLHAILEGSNHASRIRRPLEQIKSTIQQMKLLGITRKAYISPLSCYNEKFYSGSIIFQCMFDKKSKTIFATGGRYDSLIDAHRLHGQPESKPCHAVGVSMLWDSLVNSVVRHRKDRTKSTYLKKGAEEVVPSIWSTKRCEVLVASSDLTVLHTAGVKLLSTLWAAKFSSELATDAGVVDDLLSRQLETSHTWVLVVKHDAASTIKVWNTVSNVETEVSPTNLLSHLRMELREREHGSGVKHSRHPALMRLPSHHGAEPEREKGKSNVQVLLAAHKSKKGNKYNIVQAAQERWASLLTEQHSAEVLAIETKDEVLEAIRGARLSDSDSWKKVIQHESVGERLYLTQVQELLKGYKKEWLEGKGARVAGLYNFRTGGCIAYDLGA